MGRRGKTKPAPKAAVAKEAAFRPFAEAAATLKAALPQEPGKTAKSPSGPRTPSPVPAPPPPEDDRALFEAAFADVKPLAKRSRERVAPPRDDRTSVPLYDEDAETLARLAAMVDGGEPLGTEFSEEHTEWIAEDADPGILPRLVAGEFGWQEHLDLHGMTRLQAHEALFRFFTGAHAKHLRCVLVVHGRGHHSEGSIPVLKLALQRWLRRAPLKTWVFAWATARAVDGGAGAMYVLLRN